MIKDNKVKPNIVFILTDDQGPWAMGCAGNHEIKTPNLDRLAARGMRFENFFCTSPVCSPARASLLTGRIPSQHGVHDWICDGNGGKQKAIEYLEGQTAYTDILAENGYICGLSGKWHLGDSPKPQKGFTHWYVHQGGGGSYYNAPMIRNGELVNEPGYITDAITEDALCFLDKYGEGDAPFYMSVHYTAPHSPWVNNHPEDIVKLYEDCKFETCPSEEPHPWALTEIVAGWKDTREHLKGYFAAVTAMDANVGRILDRIEEKGLQENTLVIFMSDNGFNCGQHGIWGKGNGTYPFNMYDSSVKVPAIMSHPGVIPQGVTSGAIVSGYDFMPTLLDYAGLANPEAEKLPGRSFVNILLGNEEKGRENAIVFDEYGPARMIRSREWKYVHRYPYGPDELYNMKEDPEEKINLADDSRYMNVVERMKAGLDEWFIKYADPEVDGSREPVTGGGQCELAGLWGKGRKSYRPHE